jgi:hypothetical protein
MKQVYWMDERLRGGQRWWDEILAQVRDCDVLILVLTKRSITSEACRRELQYAVELGKPVLPLRLDALPEWQLPPAVSLAHVVDYTNRAESGDAGVTCAFLLKDAVDHLATSQATALPTPLPAPPEPPPTRLHDLQPFLQAKELSLAKQEEFLRGVRSHLDDEDEDRKSLVEILELFGKRQDISVRVARDVAELVTKLAQSDARTYPEELASTEPPGEDHVAASSATSDSVGEEVKAAPSAVDDGVVRSARVGRRLNFSQDRSRISRFQAPNLDLEGLGRNLSGWYEAQNLESHCRVDDERVMVQCRSRAWARRVGAGAALTALLSMNGSELSVEIGGGKWMDKVAAAGVAWFVLWPALIPATVGGWKQATLPTKTLDYIERMIPLYSQAS